MNKITQYIILFLIILVLSFGCIESPEIQPIDENDKELLSSWDGVFSYGNFINNNITNLKFYDDNTMTGSWEVDITGADNLYFTSNGTYTITTDPNGGIHLNFTAIGTASKNDMTPSSSNYTLSCTDGFITGNTARGSVQMNFDNRDWHASYAAADYDFIFTKN